MASTGVFMTRSPSSDSSAFSNITVGQSDTSKTAAATEGASDLVSTDTPPTSVSDRASPRSAQGAEEPAALGIASVNSRPRPSRAARPTYDLTKPSGTRQTAWAPGAYDAYLARCISANGGDKHASSSIGEMVNGALHVDWEVSIESSKPTIISARAQRTSGVRERMRKAAGKVGTIVGKRTREVMEAGERKLPLDKEQADPKKQRILRELDTGKKGVLDEIDLDVDYAAPPPSLRPAKRTKTTHPRLQDIVQVIPTGPLQKTSDGNRVKKWQTQGLYVGQEESTDPALVGPKKAQKKLASSSSQDDTEPIDRSTFMQLPMFNYLDKTRGFTIPYDVYAPTGRRGDEKPKDWKMLNRNRLIGEAKDLWEKEDQLPASACVCRDPGPGELGCEDDCLNRVMQYECNEDNCRLTAGICSNRPFAELQARKEKGGLYDVGVEVVKTNSCGFGIRACRSFSAGQIIMEYTGEIISEAECQRRMREEYNDKKCYYLMELERNLVIDGTKGSMARFINHSCEPNCEVRMVKVNGTPRMAVFAGELGIMTGEELSYDYNFDNFGENQQACHCGAKTCRGYLGKRLNAAEQKKQAKLAEERKRKAAEEAQKLAAAEERKRQVKNARPSNWHGWVAVDDADVKAQLKDEKRQREEAEKNTARALRMAARRGSLPAAQAPLSTPNTRSSRRKTADFGIEKVELSPTKSITRSQSKRKVASTTTLSSITVASTESLHVDSGKKIQRATKRSRLSIEPKEDKGQEEPLEKPKRKGLLSSIGDVVKSSFSGRSASSTSGKFRQSTLQFNRVG